MPGQPYVAKLPDGRYFAVELPDDSAEHDPVTGELILRAPAIHLLDRLRVLLSPLPATTTPGRIRALREALGLTEEELASRLQIDVSQLTSWEAGTVRPSAQDLEKLERLRRAAVRAGIALPEMAQAG